MTRSYGYDTATGALSLLRAGWGASPSVWFQNDSVTRDAIGNVLTATDQVTSTTECFSYDNWNRLKRARTIAAGGVCASAATAGTDSYDVSWTFDDIDRMTTRVDNTTATTSSYTYGDGAHPHAVTAVSSGGSYSYNSAGSMVSRAGTTLGYDALQRLVSYGSAESYVQSTSNQRLVKTSASGRVLYLGEIEVATNGAVRTITRYVSIAGATVAVKTSTGGTDTVMWNCASLQNSITCQAPTSGATPALKRYLPYGGPRNTVTTPNTERGFLGQTQDSSGLTYLNNRYYDPQIGVFLSVDPLVAKTGTPYLYANGNPTTSSDPSGLCWHNNGRQGADDGKGPCNSDTTGALQSFVSDLESTQSADAVNWWLSFCTGNFGLCADHQFDPAAGTNLPVDSEQGVTLRLNYLIAMGMLAGWISSGYLVIDDHGTIQSADGTLEVRAGFDNQGKLISYLRTDPATLDAQLLSLITPIAGAISDVAGWVAIACFALGLGPCAATATAVSLVAGGVEVLGLYASGDDSAGCAATFLAVDYLMPGVDGSSAGERATNVVMGLFGEAGGQAC